MECQEKVHAEVPKRYNGYPDHFCYIKGVFFTRVKYINHPQIDK